MQMISGYPSVYQWQMVKVDWKSGKQFCSMTLLAHKSHIAPLFSVRHFMKVWNVTIMNVKRIKQNMGWKEPKGRLRLIKSAHSILSKKSSDLFDSL